MGEQASKFRNLEGTIEERTNNLKADVLKELLPAIHQLIKDKLVQQKAQLEIWEEEIATPPRERHPLRQYGEPETAKPENGPLTQT